MDEIDEPKGDCFKAAFDFFLNDAGQTDGLVLVHGNVARLPQLEAVNHAWVEEGELVHEVSNGKHTKVLKDVYYKNLDITNTRQYDLDDALRLGLKRYGPWDE